MVEWVYANYIHPSESFWWTLQSLKEHTFQCVHCTMFRCNIHRNLFVLNSSATEQYKVYLSVNDCYTGENFKGKHIVTCNWMKLSKAFDTFTRTTTCTEQWLWVFASISLHFCLGCFSYVFIAYKFVGALK